MEELWLYVLWFLTKPLSPLPPLQRRIKLHVSMGENLKKVQIHEPGNAVCFANNVHTIMLLKGKKEGITKII